MKFLARLMSHGFAIAVVVLLAIGFIYRGELFPEWELPDFLVFDADEDTGEAPLTGKIEPAPLQAVTVGSGAATTARDTSDIKDDSASTGDTSQAMPSAEEVIGYGAGVVSEGKPAVAGVVTESTPAVAGAIAESQPAVADAITESRPAVADAVTEGKAAVTRAIAESKPAYSDAGGTIEAGGAGMPAMATIDAAVPAAVESTPVDAGSAAAPTAEAPVADVLREASEATTVMTGSGDVTAAVAEMQDGSLAEKLEEAAAPATDVTAGAGSGTASPGAWMSPEPAGADKASAVYKDSVSAPAGAEVAEPLAAPAPAGMGDAAQVETRATAAPRVAEAGMKGAAPASESVPDGTGITAPAGTPAQAGAAVQDIAPQVSADSEVSSYQLLASAREAYWLRDYQGAEDYYRQMIRKDPDNPDAYGELANMYLNQGKWDEAASAYYEAGSRLVKIGLLDTASEMVDVIRGLNGSQADTLEEEIQMAREASQ